ncbi:hypothetical protein LMH87_009984 [Akanthomyces muscarius]|uniref:Uncharacterized protein n=1 Tax=Akanthomyces muscarius TaxID=2231603 RepID=A0A9W8QFT0_AKAMU|nr:hypothetical protein LMH87_009984 [Akanthomyces muscarius]KAJ4153499.1 hypothetical protein LMH87_009984 [Akanthomyces muscarius]
MDLPCPHPLRFPVTYPWSSPYCRHVGLLQIEYPVVVTSLRCCGAGVPDNGKLWLSKLSTLKFPRSHLLSHARWILEA